MGSKRGKRLRKAKPTEAGAARRARRSTPADGRSSPTDRSPAGRARTDLGWLAALLAGGVYFVSMSAFYPFRDVFEFDPDEGNRVLIARTLDRGHQLYSEIWDDQPPLLSLAMTWWCRLVGWEVNNIRVLILLFAAGAVFAAYDSARLLWGHAAGLGAAALLPCTSYFMRLSVSVMVGLPAIALALLCMWALLRWATCGRLSWLLAAGVLMGLSLMTKVFTGSLLPVFGLWVLVVAWRQRSRKAPGWQILVPPALWCLAVIGVVGAVVLLVVGPADFHHLYEAHLQASRPEVIPESAVPPVLWRNIRSDWQIAILAILGTAHLALRCRWLLALAPGWCLAELVVLTLHYPVWFHHHLLLSIPACVIAGVGAGQIFAPGWKPERGRVYLARVVLRLSAAALTICLVVALARGGKREQESISVMWGDYDRFALEVMNAFKDKTRIVVSDRPMYAFRGDFAVPPNLCLTSLKRVRTGNLTVEELIETVRKHRPEQIVLTRKLYRHARAVLEAADDEYVLVYGRPDTTPIHIREDVAEGWFSIIRDLVERTRHAPAHDFLALQWIERGQAERALASLKRAVKLDPSEPDACTHLAEAYMAGARYSEAFEVLQTGRRVADKDRYKRLSRTYAWRRATCPDESHRDPATAEAVINGVIRLEGRVRAEDLQIKAAIASARGRFAQAVETATRAIELAEDDGERWRIQRLERQLQGYRSGKPCIEYVRVRGF